MNILLLRGFNNYFNRIVKKYSTLADYKSHSQSYLEFTDINFNPNDGIVTELVLGSQSQKESNAPLAWDILGTPDYLICYKNEGDPVAAVIKFRWFILESERTRDGQYRIALKRDVVAEHFDNIMSAPCFVEKGNIRDLDNPLLVNTEGSIVNQIKKSEAPLIDETDCAWLVGYIKKDDQGQSESGIMSKDLDNIYLFDSLNFKDCINFSDGSSQPSKTLINDLSSSSLNIFYTICGEQWPVDHYYDYRGSLVWNQWFRIEYQGSQGNPSYGSLTTHLIYANNNDSGPTTNWAPWMESATGGSAIPAATTTAFINYLKTAGKTANNFYEANDLASGTTVAGLRSQYNGAIITKDGKYYELSFSNGGNTWVQNTYNAGSSPTIGSYMAYVVSALNSNAGGKTTFSFNSTSSGNSLQASLNYTPIIITATEIGDVENSITINIPNSESRITCEDSQYDIFAVPYIPRQYRDYHEGKFVYNSTNYTVDSDACLFIVQKLMTKLGIQNAGGEGARAYDLQLLPYCPIKLQTSSNGVLLDQLDEESYTVITKRVTVQNAEVDMPIGYVLFPSAANFTTDIEVDKRVISEVSGKVTLTDTIIRFTNDNVISGGYMTCILATDINNSDDITLASASCTDFTAGGVSYDILKISKGAPTIANKLTLQVTLDWRESPGTTVMRSTSCNVDYMLTGAARALDVKISNECDFVRLTAPNFNSTYEFKLSKMLDNKISYINVDCTYRPINPYIKLNPDFSGLYGKDFDDSTGLLFNGDFSLATLSNA